LIETTLIFVLGFASAGFLALMIAPAIWRRAVVLTRRRIEASVPLTLNEVQADKDRMRAEFAMSTRRLEMSIKGFQQKATTQLADIGRKREELQKLADERDEKNAAISELELRGAELRAMLAKREEELEAVSTALRETEEALEDRARMLEDTSQTLEEVSLVSSNRQVDLLTRESENEKLSGDVAALREERKDLQRRLRDAELEAKQQSQTASGGQKRIAELEDKVARLVADLSDREERLERREKELARMREQIKDESSRVSSGGAELERSEAERVRLEREYSELTLQLGTLMSGAKGGDIEKAITRLEQKRNQDAETIARLTDENASLTQRLQQIENEGAREWQDERRDNAMVREQINDLAAEVIRMTALLEGKRSPITQMLEAGAAGDNQPVGGITSLSQRVRALQKAAARQGQA
jgi:chromosome segregation ATPase